MCYVYQHVYQLKHWTDSPSIPVIEYIDKNLINDRYLSSGTTIKMKCSTIGGNPEPRVSAPLTFWSCDFLVMWLLIEWTLFMWHLLFEFFIIETLIFKIGNYLLQPRLAQLQWYKDNVIVDSEYEREIDDQGRYITVNQLKMTLNRSDNGATYICTASNAAGSPKSSEKTMAVRC